MRRFCNLVSVRANILDETEPDHGVHGTVVGGLEDDTGRTTGDERDSLPFRMEFEDGRVEDSCWHVLRPPEL